jgi:ubiquinone/menaquinone biosynthesis C-methylase UbiE
MFEKKLAPSGNEDWSKGTGWDADRNYGELFYQRATGELPEMESSKAVARRLAPHLRPQDHLIDVGCGAGHYLLSLRHAVSAPFRYTGIDLTPFYIDLARKAFKDDPLAEFTVASILDLPFPDRSFDIAMCNNVLLHLPSIAQALPELCRVARRHVVVRTLIGDRSFLIKEVRNAGDEFDAAGEPREYNCYNIWSRAYVSHLLSGIDRVKNFSIDTDDDFDPSRIEAAARDNGLASNATRMLGSWQVNGYVLQPWCFLEIELKS